MGQSQYLIDTNAVIDYLGKKIASSGMDFMHNIIDAIPTISIITKIEVLGFNALMIITNYLPILWGIPKYWI
jgi:hypothetical protein